MGTTVKSTKANHRPLAVVTGASSGIAYYLAKECAENGFDLLIAADDPTINYVASDFRAVGTLVDAVESDLIDTNAARAHCISFTKLGGRCANVSKAAFSSRIDRWLYAGNVPGGLRRNHGVHGLIFLCFARGTKGFRRDGDLSYGGCN